MYNLTLKNTFLELHPVTIGYSKSGRPVKIINSFTSKLIWELKSNQPVVKAHTPIPAMSIVVFHQGMFMGILGLDLRVIWIDPLVGNTWQFTVELQNNLTYGECA